MLALRSHMEEVGGSNPVLESVHVSLRAVIFVIIRWKEGVRSGEVCCGNALQARTLRV